MHSDLGGIDDFVILCDKFLNISINTEAITQQDSFELWAKAWKYENDQ